MKIKNALLICVGLMCLVCMAEAKKTKIKLDHIPTDTELKTILDNNHSGDKDDLTILILKDENESKVIEKYINESKKDKENKWLSEWTIEIPTKNKLCTVYLTKDNESYAIINAEYMLIEGN